MSRQIQRVLNGSHFMEWGALRLSGHLQFGGGCDTLRNPSHKSSSKDLERFSNTISTPYMGKICTRLTKSPQLFFGLPRIWSPQLQCVGSTVSDCRSRPNTCGLLYVLRLKLRRAATGSPFSPSNGPTKLIPLLVFSPLEMCYNVQRATVCSKHAVSWA